MKVEAPAKKELQFLLKHSSVYGLGAAIGQAVGFLLLPLYTRYLTPADYGVLSLINITMDIAGVVAGLGIVAAMARFYNDSENTEEKHRVVSTMYWISIMSAVVFLPIFYFAATPLSTLVFKTSGYAKHFMVVSLALVIGINVDIGLTYLRVRSKSGAYVKMSIVGTVLTIGFNIYFIVIAKTGVIGIFYSSLIHKIVFSVLLGFPILTEVGIRFSRKLAKEMIKFSFPLVFSNVFRVFTNESDKYFINHFMSPFATGIYALAQRVGNSIHQLVISPFLQTYLPRRFEIMKRDDASQTYGSILYYYFSVICFIGLALSLFSPQIVRVMTTDQYYEAARYIPLAVLSMIIFGLKYHFETGIMIEKQTKYIAYINAVSAVINIVLNYYLISRYHLWGALLSLNISYSVTALLNYLVSQRMFPIAYPFGKMAALMVIGVAVFLLSLLVPSHSVLLGTASNLCLLALYVVALLYSRLLDGAELKTVAAKVLQRG